MNETNKRMKASTERIRNINLYIEQAPGNTHYIAKLCAGSGNMLAAGNFQYEPDISILAKLEDNVGKNVRASAQLIRNFGTNLFNSVFNKSLLDRYLSLRNYRIRLKLIFEKRTSELLRIPWEFMFDGEDYLSANPKMTITRVLKRTSCTTKKPVAGKLKILAVTPAPVDLPEIYRPRAEREHMIICEFMKRPGISDKMEFNFLERPTVENLKQRLDDEQHILHFTSHGIYSQKEHTCYILFEDEFKNSKRVDSETVADILAGHQSLQLVMLSCCHTVLAVGHRVLGEFPVSLLSKGIPSVIVMQYSVTDQSAKKLSEHLFDGICRGVPLDYALADARKALLEAGREGLVDFGSPVLYSYKPDTFFPITADRSKF